MTIVVGTDTYLSVTDADTYWSNKNNSTWAAAATAVKEAALREATQYLDSTYSFIGEQITTQVLAWPRYNASVNSGNFKNVFYDSSTIPPQVEAACAELALAGLSARLLPDLSGGGKITKEKVDVIEVEYSEFSTSHPTYSFVTRLLSPVLLPGGSTSRKLIRS